MTEHIDEDGVITQVDDGDEGFKDQAVSPADLMAEPETPPDTRNVHDLIRDYLALRDEIKIVNTEFKATLSGLETEQIKISMRLREIADSQGLDTLAIRGLGTAYRNTKVSYRVSDWAAYIAWCKETDNFHCIERRPAKLSVAAIHKTSGSVPPGLDYIAEQEFNVRKS